jgi:pimeloyl-ACP methyl ester carboxylesterase
MGMLTTECVRSWKKEETMPRFRALVFLVVVMTLALLAVPIRTIHAQDATPEATPAPRFTNTVEVDGRRIGLTCEGSGSPTVILSAGARSPADRAWPAVVDAISPMTRICAFDRAGLGPSDPPPHRPLTAADVVADLHAALEAAGETGPFVLLGWSAGGPIVRLYATTYLDEVVGLVLVEAVPPGLNARDYVLDWFPSEAERETERAFTGGRDPELESPIDQFMSEAQLLAAPPPPRVPTVEIVAGMIDPELPLLGDATWYEAQAYQARDLGARVVIAEESDHFIPFNQPEVIIAAIEDVVAAVRDPSSWATPTAGTPSP